MTLKNNPKISQRPGAPTLGSRERLCGGSTRRFAGRTAPTTHEGFRRDIVAPIGTGQPFRNLRASRLPNKNLINAASALCLYRYNGPSFRGYGNSHYVRVMRNFMRTTLLACVLSLCPVASGSAGPGEDGVSAFERGDYTAALWLWRPLAEKGNATAQYLIGHMYDRGLGVPQDDVMAVEWYRKAAEQGDASAQLKLGVRYAKGEGVPQDDAVAHKWLTLAASRYPASAVTWREKAIKLREASATRMTPAQIAEAHRMAREWKPKKK